MRCGMDVVNGNRKDSAPPNAVARLGFCAFFLPLDVRYFCVLRRRVVTLFRLSSVWFSR